MIATLMEFFNSISSGVVTLFLIIVIYFWVVWGIKIVFGRLYKPVKNDYRTPVSVIVPTYNEDIETLYRSIASIQRYPRDVVTEIIIVTDIREPELLTQLESIYKNDHRVRVLSSNAGKRPAIAMGITSAKEEIVVVVESDTFVNEKTIPELIKPFEDDAVGGVVADQRIFEPYSNPTNFFNMISERVKYMTTIPMLSMFNQVTVLGGRCVAYRRKAVMPLISNLLNEKFIRTQCIAGDDGRITSLLLENGWKTKYQSTSYVETVSPPTIKGLLKQRLRWFRNSARRTSRALTWDGLWVWKKKAALLQMISTWTNTIMMISLLFVVFTSFFSLNWFWFGTGWIGISLRVGILLIGLAITRVIRVFYILGNGTKKRWIWIMFFPWFLFLLFWVKIYSLVTMNRQGWVSRSYIGPGGFDK